MIDPSLVSVGRLKWRTCQATLVFVWPMRCRSGPMRREPHWNGRS